MQANNNSKLQHTHTIDVVATCHGQHTTFIGRAPARDFQLQGVDSEGAGTLPGTVPDTSPGDLRMGGKILTLPKGVITVMHYSLALP